MTAITRRRLLATSGVTVAAAGALAAIPGHLFSHRQQATAQASTQRQGAQQASTQRQAGPQAAARSRQDAPSSVPSVAYVRDAAKGEVVLMMGTQQVVRTDPGLVAYLARCCAPNAV